MYSGLLPKGLSEADLSPEEEEHSTQEEKQNTRTATDTEKRPAESEQNVQKGSSSSSSSSSSPPRDSCLPGVSPDLWQVCTHLYKSHHIYMDNTMLTFKNVYVDLPARGITYKRSLKTWHIVAKTRTEWKK